MSTQIFAAHRGSHCLNLPKNRRGFDPVENLTEVNRHENSRYF